MSSPARVSSWTMSLASLVGFAAPAAAGNVLVVDAGGGGAFTDIQPAVDAAVDGDTILVKTGTYGAFAVADKALAIVGDTGAVVEIGGAVRVYNLSAGKTVVLESLSTTQSSGGTASRGLYLSDDAGSVRIEGCTFVGATGTIPSHRSGWEGAFVESCSDVAFTHCRLDGGENREGYVDGLPNQLPGDGGDALLVEHSTVVLHDCTVRGGRGWNGQQATGYDGGWGGHGAELTDSTLLASASSFTGANGGWGDMLHCGGLWFGGSAGYGLRLVGSGSLARLQDGDETGGTPGCDIGGLCSTYCYPQLPGRSGSTIVDLPTPWRELLQPPTMPVRESTSAYLTYRGQLGDRVSLYMSTSTQSRFLSAWDGYLLVQPQRPHLMMIVGTIPASGQLTEPLWIRELPPLVKSSRLYLQAVFTDAQGGKHLSGPSSLVILDQQF